LDLPASLPGGSKTRQKPEGRIRAAGFVCQGLVAKETAYAKI